jgi:phage protein D
MASDTDPFIKATWQGQDVSSFVRELEIEDDDRLIDKAVVTFDDRVGVFAEGQTLKLELGWQSEHAVLFEGLVKEVESHTHTAGPQRTRVTAYDLAWRMNKEAKTREFTSGTLSSAVRTIAGTYSVPISTINADPDPVLTDSKPERQVNVTDWVFLQALASRYGARAWVEYNAGASGFYFVNERTLVNAPPAGGMFWCGGRGPLIEFRARRGSSAAAPSVTSTATDPATGATRTGSPAPVTPPPPVAVSDSTNASLAGDSTARSAAQSAAQAANTATDHPEDHVPSRGTVGAPSDPDRAAIETRRDLTRLLGMHADGLAVGTIHLRAKSTIRISGVAGWAEGSWYVQRAVHTYHSGLSETSTAPAAAHTHPPTPRGTYRTRFVATR